VYPRVFGKYVLERELSRGGMARVVLATLRGAGGFEKKLVVKQIRDELSFDQQFVRRFVEEAKTTVALSHPNIVPVYELGVEQGTYFLAMELVEGCSIAELARERTADGGRGVLSPEEGAYLGMEVCRALDYAHRRMKVVHRDITPRNVMLDEEGQVKLIDFGIAAPARVAGHEILGSPGHMPPEQVEGKELGPATDIFAVAVLLMEAWSGVAPFRRATPEECDDAMRGPHPRPSDADPRLAPLDDVIVRAMKLNPRERQQSAADVARALRAFLQGTDVTDIARALGDRVRALREAASDPMPVSLDGRAGEPSPTAAEMGTQTFAARDEAIRWSTPSPSEIDPPGPSTRRLSDGEERVSSAPPAPKGDPAMSIPTPLMVEPVGIGGDVVLRSARAAQEAARAAHASDEPPLGERGGDPLSDTLATRPLETPVHGHRRRRAQAAPRRARGWAAVALATAFAIGAGITWRASSTAARSEVGPTSTTSATKLPVATTAAEPIPDAPATSVSAAAKMTTPPSATTLSAGSAGSVLVAAAAPPIAAPASAPATEKAGRAVVSLLGDPGTRVSVDGTSRGSTPLRLSLEPGQHDVRFLFEPTGESRGERFSVKAAERVTVRAEFTGASPTVRIQR
jgi:serine/threonine-protein kinase